MLDCIIFTNKMLLLRYCVITFRSITFLIGRPTWVSWHTCLLVQPPCADRTRSSHTRHPPFDRPAKCRKKVLRTKKLRIKNIHVFRYFTISPSVTVLSLITCNSVELTMIAVDQNQRFSCEMFVTKSKSFTFSYKYLQ